MAGGETWREANGRIEPDGPVTEALLDLCHSYVARRGAGVPVEVAKRHDGVAGTGWLLAVAVVRDEARVRIAETLELALAAGVGLHAVADCVAYVELASQLFAGKPVEMAVEAATGRPAVTVRTAAPELCGESVADALAAGLWALGRPGGVADVVRTLASTASPGVTAAAAGLVGLRDGGGAVPAHWHRRLHCSASCLALAPGLVRARCRGDVPRGDRVVVRATCNRVGSPSLDPFVRAFPPQVAATDFLRRPLLGAGVR
ncbi:MAG: hypothetical protein ACRD2C_24750 [Acidimicrobiales bacterium]